MFIVCLLAAVGCAQDESNAPIRLSDEYVTIDKRRFSPELGVTETVHRINASDIWQTGPYCGANCLYVYLKLNGLNVSQTQLRRELPTSSKGANMLQLKLASERHGIAVEVLKTTPRDMSRLGYPFIALLGAGMGPGEDGHFVVICSESDSAVAAIDGTTGNLDRISKPLFRKAFSGYVLARRDRGILDPGGFERIDYWLLVGCALNLVAISALSLVRRV